MKILFAGTGSIAAPLLKSLLDRNLVSLVFTQPEKRGKRSGLVDNPVKTLSEMYGIPFYTPESLKKAEREIVVSYSPDLLLSFNYGRIFGPKFLSLFKRTMNVHPSLLPAFRGCAPTYGVILNRMKTTGITLQEIGLEIDCGKIYSQMEFPLDGRETNESLEARVSQIVPDFVLDTIGNIDFIKTVDQNGLPSYQNFIYKEDGILNFNRSARELHAQIRAVYPWPKAVTTYAKGNLIITGVYGSVFDEFEPTNGEKGGTVVGFIKNKGLKVATGEGYLYITKVLPPMKKEMNAASFYNGAKWIIGERLGL